MGQLLEEMPVELVRLAGSSLDPVALPDSPCSVAVFDACLALATIEALVSRILSAWPQSRFVAVAERMFAPAVLPLLRLGFKGLLTFADAPRQLAPAIAAVARGGVWVPRTILSAFLDGVVGQGSARTIPGSPTVSRREQEVLGGVLENLSNKEIASRLSISERTVKFHVSNLLNKFAVQRRADLILLSLQGTGALFAAPLLRGAPSPIVGASS